MNHCPLRGGGAKRWSQERKSIRDENLTGKIKCPGASDQGEVTGFLILSIQILCRNLRQMPRLRTA